MRVSEEGRLPKRPKQESFCSGKAKRQNTIIIIIIIKLRLGEEFAL